MSQPFPTTSPVPADADASVVGRRPRAAPSHTHIQPGDGFFELRFRAIWQFMTRQPAAFWLINLYMMFEYVRPQTIYRSIDVLPWSLWSILLCAATFAFEGKRWHFMDNAGDAQMVAFTGLILLSGVTAYRPEVTFNYNALSIWFTWFVVYFLITNVVTTEKRFFIFMIGFLLYSLKMSQHGFRSFLDMGGGFRSWGASGAPGWFRNSGEFGIQMTIFLPLSVFFFIAIRRHLTQVKQAAFLALPVSATVSIVATSSRGAIVGAGAVLLWMVARSKYKVRALPLAALAAAATFALIPPQSRDRFSSMGEDEDSVRRMTYWTQGIEIANDNPLHGVGYNNWLAYYRDHYMAENRQIRAADGSNLFRVAQVAHNPFIQAGAELGYPGVALFVSLILTTFVLNARTRRRVKPLGEDAKFIRAMALGLDAGLVGFLGSGFFVTVLYYPYFWINLAMTVALFRVAKNRLAEARQSGQPAPPTRPERSRRGRGRLASGLPNARPAAG